MKRSTILDTITIAIVFLFLYTATAKLSSFHAFTESMKRQPLPIWSKPALIWLIPISEIVVSLCLVYDSLSAMLLRETSKLRAPRVVYFWCRLGFIGSIILMTMFSIYTLLATLKVFGKVPCSCGGVIQKMGWPQHTVFNFVVLLLCIYGLKLLKRSNEPSHNKSMLRTTPA